MVSGAAEGVAQAQAEASGRPTSGGRATEAVVATHRRLLARPGSSWRVPMRLAVPLWAPAGPWAPHAPRCYSPPPVCACRIRPGPCMLLQRPRSPSPRLLRARLTTMRSGRAIEAETRMHGAPRYAAHLCLRYFPSVLSPSGSHLMPRRRCTHTHTPLPPPSPPRFPPARPAKGPQPGMPVASCAALVLGPGGLSRHDAHFVHNLCSSPPSSHLSPEPPPTPPPPSTRSCLRLLLSVLSIPTRLGPSFARYRLAGLDLPIDLRPGQSRAITRPARATADPILDFFELADPCDPGCTWPRE